jgi:hypothetical protein
MMRITLLLFALFINSLAHGETELPPMHHAVDIEVPQNYKIPSDFPLGDKSRIDCETCHAIEDIEQIPLAEVDTEADEFFRNGPYLKLTDFCDQCHDNSGLERNNIHVLLNKEGELKTEQCEYCHDEAPDPNQPYSREEIGFRLAEDKLCLGCHLKTPHLNSINHLVEVDDEMFEQIQRSEKELQVSLPLDGRKIRCTTCHSAHEQGVIDIDKPAGKMVQDRPVQDGIGYRKHPWNRIYVNDKKKRLEDFSDKHQRGYNLTYQRIEHEVLLRLPAKDGALCLACHQFDD